MGSQLQFNESAACDQCGQFGAYEFDGERLCADCYEKRGSCCAEFMPDSAGSRVCQVTPASPAPHPAQEPPAAKKRNGS